MVAYGFERGIGLGRPGRRRPARRRPAWKSSPTGRAAPTRRSCADVASDRGLTIHSAHGCWGGQSIRAPRVDLGSTDPATWRSSLDDLRAASTGSATAGGSCLVVHPGGYSDPGELDARATPCLAA